MTEQRASENMYVYPPVATLRHFEGKSDTKMTGLIHVINSHGSRQCQQGDTNVMQKFPKNVGETAWPKGGLGHSRSPNKKDGGIVFHV